MPEKVGLVELDRFHFRGAKLNDACSGSEGTSLLLSIPICGGCLDGAEDTDVAPWSGLDPRH